MSHNSQYAAKHVGEPIPGAITSNWQTSARSRLGVEYLDGALDRFRELLQQPGAPPGSVPTFSRAGDTHMIPVATGGLAPSAGGGYDSCARRLLNTDAARLEVPDSDPGIVRQTAERCVYLSRSLFNEAAATV